MSGESLRFFRHVQTIFGCKNNHSLSDNSSPQLSDWFDNKDVEFVASSWKPMSLLRFKSETQADVPRNAN